MYTTTAMRIESALLRKEAAETHEALVNAEMEAKQLNITSQLLDRTLTMYDHVKRFGIDRTFVSLYNRHGELDRVCNIRFPSCESMDTVGDRYSYYSTRFLVAMEADSGGAWEQFKTWMKNVWGWITEKIGTLWGKIKTLFGLNDKKVNNMTKMLGGLAATAGVAITGFLGGAVGNLAGFVKDHKAYALAIGAAASYAMRALEGARKVTETVTNTGNVDRNAVKAVQNDADAAQAKLKEAEKDGKGFFSLFKNVKNAYVTARQAFTSIKDVWGTIKSAGNKWEALKGSLQKLTGELNTKISITKGGKLGKRTAELQKALTSAQNAANAVVEKITWVTTQEQTGAARSNANEAGKDQASQQDNSNAPANNNNQGTQAQPAQNGGNTQQQQ